MSSAGHRGSALSELYPHCCSFSSVRVEEGLRDQFRKRRAEAVRSRLQAGPAAGQVCKGTGSEAVATGGKTKRQTGCEPLAEQRQKAVAARKPASRCPTLLLTKRKSGLCTKWDVSEACLLSRGDGTAAPGCLL